ncbi:MAG: TetR/AcrR family transcriptional regulator [Eubacteriales bacterium]|nr:TetR/AcrR family transcriptional regulator [Eubacteriales bacterium]
MGKTNTTQKRILDIADELFSTQGFDSVSIQDICDKANITKTTFYYYFTSKESLLDQYLTPPEVASYDILRLVFSMDSYWKQIWLLTDHTLKTITDKGSDFLSLVIKANLSRNCQTFQPLTNDLLNISLPLVQKAQAAGEIRNQSDAETLVEVGWLQILGYCTSWCFQNGEFDLRQAKLSSLETLYDVAPEYRFTLEEIDEELSKY